MSEREAGLVRRMANSLANEDMIEVEDYREAQALAARLAKDEPQVVEQLGMVAKSPAIPDGWSWDDIGGFGKFTGNFSGIALQKGEPILEQEGHRLFVRLGEFYTERQVPIFRDTSMVPGQTVLVVMGLKGKREGYVVFENGEQQGPVFVDSPKEITAWIIDWLKRAVADPLPSSTEQHRRKPAPKLPLEA